MRWIFRERTCSRDPLRRVQRVWQRRKDSEELVKRAERIWELVTVLLILVIIRQIWKSFLISSVSTTKFRLEWEVRGEVPRQFQYNARIKYMGSCSKWRTFRCRFLRSQTRRVDTMWTLISKLDRHQIWTLLLKIYSRKSRPSMQRRVESY